MDFETSPTASAINAPNAAAALERLRAANVSNGNGAANETLDSEEGQARSALGSDLDTFLQLLTAQIRNQDPLKPTDATQYSSQLAEFSNVEQGVRTNELLSDMMGQLARQDMAIAGSWIGMDVKHEGPVALSGEPVKLYFDIPANADSAKLIVRDQNGAEVMSRAIDATTSSLEWSGGDGRGNTLPNGLYAVSVVGSAGDQALAPTPVSQYSTVREVTLGEASAEVILANGARMSMSDLQALRLPG